MSPKARRAGVGVLLLALAAGLGWRSWRQLERGRKAIETCDLLQANDLSGAIRASEGLVEAMGDADPMLPDAARCRCLALAASDRREECLALADGLKARLGLEWVTDPTLALVLTGALLAQDRGVDALELLRAAEATAPGDLRLLSAELRALAQTGDFAGMRSLAGRVAALPREQTTALRIGLGSALAGGGEIDAALAAMEPSPDPTDPGLREWFKHRAYVAGTAGREDVLAQTFARWRAEGGRPEEIALYEVVTRDITHQMDPALPPDEALRRAIDQAPADLDPDLLGLAWRRLIGAYVNEQRPEQALAAYDEAISKGVALVGVSREELVRGGPVPEGTVLVRFRVPEAAPGDLLRVSPPPAAPADTPYEDLLVAASGEVTLSRPAGALVRWVLVDAAGQAVGSGAAIASGRDVVSTGARVPVPPPAPFVWSPAPADGRRRVFVVVVDCGDWRLARLLGARGELPALSALEAAGVWGVTTSQPSFTGVAMEKLAHPQVHPGETFLGLLHDLGVEAAGLESVGTNPLDGLSWVLPESPYLVDVVGATDKVAANLLFAVGDIDASRDMVVVGPRGRTEKLSVRRRRPLSAEERAALPGLGRTERSEDPGYLEGLAAQLDLAVALASERRLDLLLLRLAQTDLMTHREFSTLTRPGADNADNILLWTYRYVDRRLGELASALDGDDVLIVMSDHGIETSMLHSPEAMFVMAGAGRGRLEGAPEIAGVPRLLASLLGVVPVPGWPDTGLLGATQGGGASSSR